MNSVMLSPADIGLPSKFQSWHPGQWETIEQISSSDRRFIAMSDPTGSGKSVKSVGAALIEGGRAAVLTSTKALQRQYMDDFSSCGMTDIRGRQNFPCLEHRTCQEGRLLKCSRGIDPTSDDPDGLCPYLIQRRHALNSNLAVTNYDYYLSSVIHSDGIGPLQMLVLDEAHSAIQELSDAIQITFNHRTYNHIYSDLDSAPPYGKPLPQWKEWALQIRPALEASLKRVKAAQLSREAADQDRLLSLISRLSKVADDWIVDESVRGETTFAPLWPTDQAEPVLFRGTPRVLLSSATLVPKSLSLLGIPESDSLFLSTPHTFNPDRSPVYLYGASRIDHKTKEGAWAETMGRMDMLISRRLDRKGVIHPVSYENQSRILRDSEWADLMIAPRNAQEFQSSIDEFRRSSAPRIFMTPAATTGYDFPGAQCEYQILLKVPFRDTRGPIMEARTKSDPDYAPYLTAQTLVQTCGRGMRAPWDQCENFILDQHANWFLKPKERKGFRHLVPYWFTRQLRYPTGPPQPPPTLASQQIAA